MKFYNKIIGVLILGVVVWGFSARIAEANGADERYIDGIIVALSPAPLSPLVGEKVGMLFGFHDAKTLKYLTTIPRAKVTIRAFIIKGRKAGDVIFETAYLDSSSGSFNVDYKFAQEGTYDIHVIFTTPEGKMGDVGYLKQIRSANMATPDSLSNLRVGVLMALIAIGSLMIGHYLGRYRRGIN